MSADSSSEDSGPDESANALYTQGEEPSDHSGDEAGAAAPDTAAPGAAARFAAPAAAATHRGGGARGGAHAQKPPGKNDAPWARVGIDLDIPPFTAPTGIIPPPGAPPVHTIDLFITPAILEMIRLQTNRRAHLELGAPVHKKILDAWNDVSLGEVNAYIAIVITMGMKPLPDERDYWSSDPYFNVPFVSNLISRDRFLQIKHCLMVANPTPEQNTADRLAKVRAFLDLVNNISRDRYNPHNDLSLDESQCQCGHRHSRISYRGETKKPMADYIKIISLHCAHCGYTYSFYVDTRAKDESVAKLVLKVCAPLPKQPFRIATDRFYTSVSTAKALLALGLYMYGTIRTDRGIDKELLKIITQTKLNDGQCVWSMADPGLLCCVWRDTKESGVWFLSTCHDGRAALGEVQRRKSGQPRAIKSAPQVAIDYNKYMGGYDRANSLRSSYNTHPTHKSRWYMSLFYHGLDVLVVNATIYHNADKPVKDQVSHTDFRKFVAEFFATRALAQSHRQRTPEQGRRVRLRLDELPAGRWIGTHTLEPSELARSCVWCYKTLKKESKSAFRCPACNVHLHARCFSLFHGPNAQI